MLDGPQSDHPRICPPHVGRHGEAGGDRGGDEGGEEIGLSSAARFRSGCG